MAEDGRFRIGELSRRVDVSPELLRAWEKRYGLLNPHRSAGGFRLYSEDDERRVRVVKEHLASGYSAAEAARLAVSAPAPTPAPAPGELEGSRAAFRAALDEYDDARGNRILDDLLAAYTAETVVRELLLPYLAELGDRWEQGDASVAQEHFASHVIRGRLLGLARGWGQGGGPRALLACAPEELHDLPLLMFGLALRARGWRITYLGSDTPLRTLEEAAETLDPDLVVVTASTPERLRAAGKHLSGLAASHRVALAGRGVAAEHAPIPGIEVLTEDPVTEAERLSAARG